MLFPVAIHPVALRGHGAFGDRVRWGEVLAREAHPEVYGKAAALMHGLAMNHPFVDGNKRVALAATLIFLEVNGYRLALGAGERYELTMQLAAGSVTLERLVGILRSAID